MYLSKSKIFISNLISFGLLLIGGFFVFIGIIGVGLVISALFGSTTVITDDEIGDHIVVYLGFLIFFAPIMWIAVRRFGFVGKAYKFNSLFESDSDGCLLAENTAKLFGIPLNEFADLFNKLVRMGFLVNCSLKNPDNPVIILNNGAQNVLERFDIVTCPNCGAPNKVKLGFVEECRYCGSKAISGKMD